LFSATSVSIRRIFPTAPLRTISQNFRISGFERHWLPVCRIRPCFRTAAIIFGPSAMVSVSGFWQ